jgi:tetratricopeptide (TPR) repeat protein
MKYQLWVAGCVIMAMTSPAVAGDVPLYQAVPDWIEKAVLPDPAKLEGEPPMMLVFDNQQRIEDGRLWSYADIATRAGSADALGQLSSFTLPWSPDKGDLIVHEVTILRGGQAIDALASGKGFSVLRREENLEQRVLTGILTATMAVEGVQVGDIVRLRYSTTARDDVLAGHVQTIMPLFAAPLRIGFGRFRMQWANASAAKWKLLATGLDTKEQKKGGFTEVSVALPLIKQPEMPGDAPLRYQRPPLFELSTFTGWADVSKIMAPLYATRGLIADQSPLADELVKLRGLPGGQREKAAAALQLVQDHVRYLAIGMNGGNYVPQSPAQTWTLRYGDCKAKTLLLLALLQGLGIEAEPVLASGTLGDFVSSRLPSIAAFDHILVRVVIDGQTLWLDGTGRGQRIEDLGDTPPFNTVLPVRAAGADLVRIDAHANARPLVDLAVDADESASVDTPVVFDAIAILRGPISTMFNLTVAQLDAKQRSDMIRQFFTGQMGESQFSGLSVTTDDGAATTTLKAHGVTTESWRLTDKRFQRGVGKALDDVSFSPDRARPAWAAIPVATPRPAGMRYRLRLRLPDGGQGYTVDGTQNVEQKIAGYDFRRTMQVHDGVVELEERIDSTGAEIPAERDRLATAQAQAPRIVAPPRPVRYWELPARGPSQPAAIKRIDDAFTQAIAEDPEEMTGYQSRATFRWAMADRKAALADIDKAIGIEPDISLYLRRANMRYDMNDMAGALADAKAARDLDPSSPAAVETVARYTAEGGDIDGAVALIDQRIALGAETRDAYRVAKADLFGTYGDPTKGLALLDEVMAEKPGMPDLLNMRCWLKGTRLVLLETALKDCTSAIELSSITRNALDSRALVWFRLGRYDDALADLDVVLADAPAMAPSRFLRGLVLHKLGRQGEGDADVALARRLEPRIDTSYARFGLRP